MTRFCCFFLLFYSLCGFAQPKSNTVFTDLDTAYKYKDSVRYLALKRERIIPEKLKYASEMPHLESLTLISGYLSEIPAEIYQLKNLRRLTVNWIKIQKIPEELTRLKKLQHLEISSTPVQEIPDWLYKMKHLQTLQLSHNKISHINNDIRLSPSLWYLDLSNNQLKELPPSFSQLKYLARLYIRNNRFEVFPKAIISLPKLKTLDLGNNQLVQLPELSAMPELETLFISGNPLSDGSFWGFPASLKSFYAYDCSFSTIPPSLKDCRSLETLIITHGNIKAIPDWVAAFNSLKWINLEKNKITSLPPFFKQLQLLEKLILNQNSIDSIPPEIFEMTALKQLSINNNPVRHIPPSVLRAKSFTYLDIENTLVPKEEYTYYRKTGAKKPLIISANDKYTRYDALRNKKGPCYTEDEIFDYDVFTKTEVPASFIKNYAFFNQNLCFPDIASPESFSDTVVLKFIVKPWGGITRIIPLQTGYEQTTGEAIRLLKLSCPYWKPGISGGRELLAWSTIQFVFTQSSHENHLIKTHLLVQTLPQGNRYIKPR